MKKFAYALTILIVSCSTGYMNKTEDGFRCNYPREQFINDATSWMLRNGFEVVRQDAARGILDVMKAVTIDKREAELYFNFKYESNNEVSAVSKSKIWNNDLSTEEEYYNLKNYRPEIKKYMMILDSIHVYCTKVAYRN